MTNLAEPQEQVAGLPVDLVDGIEIKFEIEKPTLTTRPPDKENE